MNGSDQTMHAPQSATESATTAREALQVIADKLAEMLQATYIRRGPKHIRASVGEMQQAVIEVESFLELN